METFPQTETTFLLPGPVGNIEVVATPVKPDTKLRNAIAVVCHPHSLHGGTMNNKVVTTLARAFGDLGLPTVRFNFRGVGKSEGVFDDGIGEQDDLLAVIEWVKKVLPEKDIWLAGFSFGSAVTAHVATKIDVTQLVSVAPPVPRFNLLHLPPIKCPWLIIQGEEDEIVVPQDVYDWVETRNPKPNLIRVQEVGHFFHGKLLELRLLIELTFFK